MPVVLQLVQRVVLVSEHVKHVESHATHVVVAFGVNPVLHAAKQVVPCRKGRPVSATV